MKKTLSIILVCAIAIVSLCVTVSAAVKPEMDVCWDNISRMRVTHNTDLNPGISSGLVVRQNGTTRSEGTLTVYKKIDGNWIYVDSWYNSTTTTASLVVNGEFYIDDNATEYKSVFSVTVYRGTVAESHTVEYIS